MPTAKAIHLLTERQTETLCQIMTFFAIEGFPHATKEMMEDYEAISALLGMGEDDASS